MARTRFDEAASAAEPEHLVNAVGRQLRSIGRYGMPANIAAVVATIKSMPRVTRTAATRDGPVTAAIRAAIAVAEATRSP